jgi:GntR family transcriptional regulator/MocR family aminotransferase
MPSGAVTRSRAPRGLLDWAAAHDAFRHRGRLRRQYRYDREPLGALQGLGGGRVVYHLGSTSETLAPALRLGWMVLPGALAGAVADERGWTDGGSPVLDQLALAAFIERGESIATFGACACATAAGATGSSRRSASTCRRPRSAARRPGCT